MNKLKEHRLSLGMSQAKFCEHLGGIISQSHLCEYENGRRGIGRVKAAKISRLTGIPPGDLLWTD